MTYRDGFRGAARYYAQYRLPYPAAFLQRVLDETVGTNSSSLLDLGCGTGELTVPMSAHFQQVTAIDVDRDMITQAQQKALKAGARNIQWHVGPAESLDLAPRSFDLITAGSSYHWMDRERLTPQCRRALKVGGAMALLGTNGAPWAPTEDWHHTVIEVIQATLGAERRTGTKVFAVRQRHEDFLPQAGFSVDMFEYAIEQHWTIENYMGYLYSTSYANPSVLGEHRAEFEHNLRVALEVHGELVETVRFYAVLGLTELSGAGNWGKWRRQIPLNP
jgi:ubiquinone/menaquinone biosynthesis C-methylase UbiE